MRTARVLHHTANVSERARAVLPPIAGFYERLPFAGGGSPYDGADTDGLSPQPGM